ncbi:uncharacterized protein LOC120330347 [Styela clava]
MGHHVAQGAVVIAMAFLASALVDIPADLKSGKMSRYGACRKLFSQNIENFAIESENHGSYKKVCNCSFHVDPPQSGLRIKCHFAKDTLIPISVDAYRHLGQILYFLIQYRIRGTGDPWLEKRIEVSANPQAQIDMDLGSGDPNVYEVNVYAVLSDNTRRLILSDQLSAATGSSIFPTGTHNKYPGNKVTEHSQTQYTQSFSMSFDRVTDTSMDITFTTDNPEVFKVEYIDNGEKLLIHLDENGQATLSGLTPSTDYIFIVSYYRDGEYVEMRRKTVTTSAGAGGGFYTNTYKPTYNFNKQDVTLECPVIQDVAIQTIAWYKGEDRSDAELIASYDVDSSTTTYASDRDPKIEVVDGTVLKIKDATPDYAGHYKCRFTLYGSQDTTWQNAYRPDLVTLYITWETRPGIRAYYIQYRPYYQDASGRWYVITLPDTDRPSTLVKDLTPQTRYSFRVYDYSGGIQGDLLDTLDETTGRLNEEGDLEPPEPVLPDPCGRYYCGRGRCTSIPTVHCECDQGFTGERCDIAINLCDSDPCQNGGTCHSQFDRYLCQCRRGFSGDNCERERTLCNPNPCQHNGVCISSRTGYNCRCKQGYGGSRCQTLDTRSPCDTTPCLHGKCTVLGRNYHCECNRGYEGRNCDQIDNEPSILLRCGIQEETYGRADMIQWVAVQDSGRRQEIYTYDVANNRKTERNVAQFRDRLWSPTPDSLLIRDATLSDVGTYECIVSYTDIRITPSPMRLIQVPYDDTRVTVRWRPNRMFIDHYNAKYRDVYNEDDFVTVEIPRGSSQHTFNDLEPGSVYEIAITPYTRPGEVNQDIVYDVLPSTSPTTAATTPTTTRPPSRADKQYDRIDVTVYGPSKPVDIGSTTYIHCVYPSFEEYKPVIAWKKVNGNRSVYVYNQQMPPRSSRNRISMTTERQLRIKNFQQTDAGIYECTVKYDTPYTQKVGTGSVNLDSAEVEELPAPTRFRADITGPTTTVLTWQAPRVRGITGYVVIYYPTNRQFGAQERREVSTPQVVLDDLVEGNEYKVEIRASDSRRYSEPLEGLFEQLVELLPAPTNFQAEMLSKTQARVSWDRPASGDITGYKVQYWDVSQPTDDTIVTRVTRLNQIVLPELIDGKQYQVWIQSSKGSNLSPHLAGQFTKTTPAAPNPPTQVQFKNVENDRVTVYWDAPPGWTSSDKYRVTVQSLNEDFPYSKQYPDSAQNLQQVNLLRPGVTYRFTVNSVRNGVLSAPAYQLIKTVEVIALSAPYPDSVTLECKAKVSGRPYRVRWYKVRSDGREQIILTSVSTSRRNQTTPNPSNLQFRGRLSSPSITELTIQNIQYPEDFGRYKCAVTAPSGTGSDLMEIVAKYPDSIAPPYKFAFRFVNERDVVVTWQHPYPEDITGYAVRYWPTSRRYGPEKELETSTTEATLTGLVKGTEYQVEIKSKINDRVSDDSLVGAFIRFADKVSDVRVHRLPDGQELIISWQNPEDIDGILFSIRNPNTHTWNDQPPMSPDTTSRRIRLPMAPGETASFKISTLKNNIPTPVVFNYTEIDVIEIEDTGTNPPIATPTNKPGDDRSPLPYPSPVSNLQAEALSPTSLRARWEPTPDVYFDNYKVVILNAANQQEYERFDIVDSKIEVTGMPAYQTYEIQVYTIRRGISSFPVVTLVRLGDVEQVPPDEPEPTREDKLSLEREPQPSDRTTDEVPMPTNMKFTNVMRSRFTISWDSPRDDITDFEVKYRPEESGADWYQVTAEGYTSVTLRGLKSDTTYVLLISSKLESGEKSAPLAGRQRTRPASERRVILHQPIVRVPDETKTSTSFVLKWTEQDAEHRVTVTPIGGAGRRQRLEVPRGTSSIEITGLETGKRHRTTVEALSGGRKSRPAVIYTTTKPNQPGDLDVTALSYDSVALMWTEPISTLTTGYKVLYYPLTTHTLKEIDVTTNRVEITDLQPDTEYTIQVQTKQGSEMSAPVATTITTRNETVSTPSKARVSVSGNDFIVQWSPVQDAEAYEITIHPEGDESKSHTETVESPTTTLRLPNVEPGHYVISIQSVKEDYLSPTIDITAHMPVKPPTSLRLTGITNDEITAIWQPPSNLGYTPKYDVIALLNSVFTPLELPSEKRTNQTTYTFRRLRPNTEYRIEVITRYGDQKSEPISAVVTTAPVDQPRNVQSRVINGVIRIEWSPVDGADNYELTYHPVDDASRPVTVQLPSGSEYYDLPNVGPGQYEIEIVAVKDDQRSPTATARERIGIDSPSNVRFSDITEDSAVIEWRPPRTRQRFSYEVKLVPAYDTTGTPITGTTENRWYSFSDLKPGTRYNVEVVSVFIDQKSSPVSSSFTTEIPVVRRVDAPKVHGNQPVDVIWQEVPDADSYIVTYYPIGGNPQTLHVAGETNNVKLYDLEPETEYVVKVTTIYNGAKGPPKTLELTTGPVGSPENLETRPSSDRVRVVWSPVDHIDYYEITYNPIHDRRNSVTKRVSSPYYDITGVEPGEYEITVTAVKQDHKSPASRLTESIGVKPPTDIQFTDVSEDEFIVVWFPSRTHGRPRYVIRVTNPEDLTWEPTETETADTFVSLRNLTPGTTYFVQVLAKRGEELSLPLEGFVTTAVPSPQGVDESLVPGEDGSIEVTWHRVPNADNYEVTYYPVGGNPEILLVDGDQTGTVIYDLQPDTEYTIEVTSILNDVASQPTTIKVVTPLKTPEDTEAEPLTNRDRPDSTSVRVRWDIDDTVPEYEVKYYSVIRIGDEEIYGEPRILRVPSRDGGVTINHLMPATEYIVEVKAVSGPKTSQPGKVTVTTPLDRPDRVDIGEPGEENITIQWQHPVGEVTEYVVELVPTDGSDGVITLPVRPGRNSITATGLQPGTEYEVRVVAVNKDKNISSRPVVERIRTKPRDVKPGNIRMEAASDGSYTITWDKPATSIKNYIIRWQKRTGTPSEDSLAVSGDQTQVTIPQLLPNTEYDIILQSILKPGDQPNNHNSITRRIQTEIPGLPDSITLPSVTDTSVVVQWNPPSQVDYLTGYRVEVYTDDSAVPVRALDVPKTQNRVTFPGLKPNTNYIVKVTPHINRRPGQPATQSITTDALRTVPMPDYVSIPESTSEDIVIQWYAPQNHDYITKYNVQVVDVDGNVIVNEDVAPDTYTYTVTDLNPGTSYDVYVRSFINDRESEPASEIANTLPEQPQRVTTAGVLPRQFEITWDRPAGEVIAYLVNVEPQDNPNAEELFFETEQPSILIPDAEPDTTYTIQVITVGPGNFESVPTTITMKTPEVSDSTTTPPQEFRPEESISLIPGQPEFVINWEQQPDEPVVSYQILYRIRGDDKTNIITVPSGVGQTILSTVEPTAEYIIWVKGLLDNGEIIPVPIIDHEIVSILSPDNYMPLTKDPVTVPADGKISIIWETLGPDVTEYGISYLKPDSEEPYQVVIPGTYTSTQLSGLRPDDEYVITVIGMRNGQEPVVVQNVNYGTSDYVPDESAVTGSTPTGQVTVQWFTDIEPEQLEKVIGYTIIFDRKCCIGEPEMAYVPGKDAESATLGMLEPGIEYIFTVQATTADGQNIPVPDIQLINVPKLPETRVTGGLNPPTIAGVDGQGYAATVFWNPPRQGRIPLTHYAVSYIPVDNLHTRPLTVLVPKTERSHTVTGLAPDTLYRIRVQSANLPSKTTSDAATASYLTPIDSPAVTDDYVEPVPTDDTSISNPAFTTTPARTISIRTRPSIRPDRTTTTGIPEPLRSTSRTSTLTPSTTNTTRRPSAPTTTVSIPTDFDDDTDTITTSDIGQMTIMWEPFFTEDENGRYRIVFENPTRPDDIKEIILPDDTQTVTVSSLEPDTSYNVHVEAVTDSDEIFVLPVSTTEDELPRTLHPYRLLFKPTITSIEPFSNDATIINWAQPRNQHRPVTHYILELKPKFSVDPTQTVRVEVPADKTSHVVTGLQPNQEYIVTLQAANKPTKTRSSTTTTEFITGTLTIPETTTRRTHRTRPSTRPTQISRFTTRRQVIVVPTEPTPAPVEPYEPVEVNITSSTTRRPIPSRITPILTRPIPSRITPILTRPIPSRITPLLTRPIRPLPRTTQPNEPNEGGNIKATTTTPVPQPTGGTVDEDIRSAGVDALPTFDGQVIINWTPAEIPVDHYILEWKPNDRTSPGTNITIPGDTSWTSIPEPTSRPGYIITIYTVDDENDQTIPIYNVQLSKSPDKPDGYILRFKPSEEDENPVTVTEIDTQEIFIPGSKTSVTLPEDEYAYLPGTENGGGPDTTIITDREYVNWIQPVEIPARRVGGSNTVTLRWNPVTTTETSRVNRFRVELVPINDPTARKIVTYVPTNAPMNIRGLQPGVSYRLYAKYIQNDGEHRTGDIATDFVIPAFTRHGIPVTERHFGVKEVWMRELGRSGNLVLQWNEFPGATNYTIEYEESPGGTLQRVDLKPGKRSIVLPRLPPGHIYTINIYATVDGVLTKIYTVTVRRKVTGPSPPPKVEWYNMFGHSVDLSWTPPPMYITGYRITYRLVTTDDSAPEYVVNIPVDETTYTLTDLIPGETYNIMIQSVRDEEISRAFTFPLRMLIPTVRKIYFQQTSPKVIVIRWPLLPEYVTGYLVQVRQVSPPGPDLIQPTVLLPDQSDFTINNVQPDVRYEFSIQTMIGDKLSDPVKLQLWILASFFFVYIKK